MIHLPTQVVSIKWFHKGVRFISTANSTKLHYEENTKKFSIWCLDINSSSYRNFCAWLWTGCNRFCWYYFMIDKIAIYFIVNTFRFLEIRMERSKMSSGWIKNCWGCFIWPSCSFSSMYLKKLLGFIDPNQRTTGSYNKSFQRISRVRIRRRSQFVFVFRNWLILIELFVRIFILSTL